MRATLSALVVLALAGAASAQTSPPNGASPVPAAPPAAGTRPPAALNIRTTRDLVNLCDTSDTDPGYPGAIGLCVGYGSGVIDYHFAENRARSRGRKVCLPSPPPTRGEARKMFIAWARTNQQYMDEPAVNGVMRFAITTFPCHK